jgi:hypothetical protein
LPDLEVPLVTTNQPLTLAKLCLLVAPTMDTEELDKLRDLALPLPNIKQLWILESNSPQVLVEVTEE